MVDLGTGDGVFVYQSARRNPGTFYIGVDANAGGVRSLSERICRRAERGGAANALYLRAAAADLPAPLTAIAAEVHVQFPWGTLLQAVAGGAPDVLRRIVRLCAPGGKVVVTIGIDARRDRREWERLELEPPCLDRLRHSLPDGYRQAGLEPVRLEVLSPAQYRCLSSSWARRLTHAGDRVVIRLTATAPR